MSKTDNERMKEEKGKKMNRESKRDNFDFFKSNFDRYRLIFLPHKYLNLKLFFLFWRRDSNWPVAQTRETAVPQPSFGLSTIEAVRPFVVPYTPVGSIFSAFY